MPWSMGAMHNTSILRLAHCDTLWLTNQCSVLILSIWGHSHSQSSFAIFNKSSTEPYLIFVLFSPHAQFLNKFFSTQKCVNRNKIDFAPIQRKWQQSRFCDKSAWIVTKKLSPHSTCGEMYPHDRFYFTFLHMTWFFSLFTMWRHISNWTFVMWRHFSTWQSVT